MSALFLWIICALYLGAAIAFAFESKPAWAVMLFCYAIANVAVIYTSR